MEKSGCDAECEAHRCGEAAGAVVFERPSFRRATPGRAQRGVRCVVPLLATTQPTRCLLLGSSFSAADHRRTRPRGRPGAPKAPRCLSRVARASHSSRRCRRPPIPPGVAATCHLPSASCEPPPPPPPACRRSLLCAMRTTSHTFRGAHREPCSRRELVSVRVAVGWRGTADGPCTRPTRRRPNEPTVTPSGHGARWRCRRTPGAVPCQMELDWPSAQGKASIRRPLCV